MTVTELGQRSAERFGGTLPFNVALVKALDSALRC